MKDSVVATFIFDGISQHGAVQQHMMHRWKFWILLRATVCLFAVIAGGYLIVTRGQHVLAGFLVAGGAAGFLRPMVWQMWSERRLRKHPAYGKEVSFCFGIHEITMKGGAGDATLRWEKVYEVVSCKRGILIYVNAKDYLWVPNSAFVSAKEKQRALRFSL